MHSFEECLTFDSPAQSHVRLVLALKELILSDKEAFVEVLLIPFHDSLVLHRLNLVLSPKSDVLVDDLSFFLGFLRGALLRTRLVIDA